MNHKRQEANRIKIKEKDKMNKAFNDAVEDIKLVIPYDETLKGYSIDYITTNKNMGYKIKISIEKIIPDSAYL